MQTIRNTKQGFQLQTVEKPVPDAYEVLIKVYFSTVTRGDTVLSELPNVLYWSPIRRMLGIPPKKNTPGHEFSGVVEAVGNQVTHFKIGDAIFGTTTGLKVGANAEYVCVPEVWDGGVLIHKPENITFRDVAALPVGGMTALYLLKKATIQRGDKVLIYGASGSVGSFAVQLAHHFGAEVTGVTSTRNIDLVYSLGADMVMDYTTDDLDQATTTYDVIVDTVGKMSFSLVKHLIRETGRAVSIRETTHETTEALEFLVDLAASDKIKPVIDRCYPLEQIVKAYEYVKTGRKIGNVIIQVADLAIE